MENAGFPRELLTQVAVQIKCGTLYRRCTWFSHGKKHVVWRCISRIDYGRQYCRDSPSIDEQQLQRAILRTINGVMSDKETLMKQVEERLLLVLSPPKDGELTTPAIDRQLEALAREFDTALAAAASGNSGDYSDRFKNILARQTELKSKRTQLETQQAEKIKELPPSEENFK